MMREIKNQIKGVSKKGLGIGRRSSYITLTVFFTTYIVFVLAIPQLVHAAVFNCSNVTCLINKINQANTTTVADTINLAAGTYTLTAVNNNTDGDNGLPSIRSKIIIKGAGVNSTIVKASSINAYFRIFHVAATGNLTLDRLTITNGYASFEDGGGIYNNSGIVNIVNSKISDNGAEGGKGGGIYNKGGTVNINKSIIYNNLAELWGGGIDSFGGTVNIINSTLSTNESFAFDGGGISSEGATVNIYNSDISNNISENVGGGISQSGGIIRINNTTISGNRGGGIYNYNDTLTVTNSTIVQNYSVEGGGIAGTANLRNTILALNTSNSYDNPSPDCSGSITSLGNNIIGDTTGCTITLKTTDKTGDPGLGTFTDNGTPGNGHFPLLSTSQAIDAGSNAVCFSNPQFNTDQLGNPRVDGNGDGSVIRDIGAVEFGSTPATCSGAAVTILGTAYSDTLNGTLCADVINGLAGSDTISGLAGNDIICGGTGNDLLKGGQGNDTLNGEKDHDTLMGEVGNDKLNGGDGTDTCNGGDGTDTATNCETIRNVP